MCSYLNRTGPMYYFRRPVPRDLIGHFTTASGKPRTEWKFSLGVSDREAAKPRLRPHEVDTDKLIADARLARKRPQGALSRDSNAPPTGATRLAQDDLDYIKGSAQLDLDALRSERDAEADPLRAERDALRDEAGLLRDARVNRELARELRAEETARTALPLTTLFDRFAAIPGRSPKTMAQWRTYVIKLAAHLGRDDIHAVTRKSLIEWRVHLRDVQKYKGKPLSPKTINDSYLGAISALFAWAVGDGIVDANPMDGVTKISALRQPQTRTKELATNEALTILRASLIAATGREGDDWRNAKRNVSTKMRQPDREIRLAERARGSAD